MPHPASYVSPLLLLAVPLLLRAATLPVAGPYAVPFAPEPSGLFATAVASGGTLANPAATDSRHRLALDAAAWAALPGAVLVVEAHLLASASNAVWLAAGGADVPDFLRLGCEHGRWHILAGAAARAFGPPAPDGPDLPAARALRLKVNLDGGVFRGATAWTSYAGGPWVPAPELSPDASAWESPGNDPRAWTAVEASLRGAGAALLALDLGWEHEPSLLIVR